MCRVHSCKIVSASVSMLDQSLNRCYYVRATKSASRIFVSCGHVRVHLLCVLLHEKFHFSAASQITVSRHYARVFFTASALPTHTCLFNASLSRPLKSRAAYPRLQACSGAKLVAPCRHPSAHVWRSSVRTATPFYNFRRRFNTAARTLRGLRIRFFSAAEIGGTSTASLSFRCKGKAPFSFVSPMELIYVIGSVRSLNLLCRSLYLTVSLSFDIVSYRAVTVVVI